MGLDYMIRTKVIWEFWRTCGKCWGWKK